MGTSVMTPAGKDNPPGLSAIAYRTGTWATFKESMLARLSSSDYPALAGLKTREDNDFTIALLDATALMLDILTFYQERLANESYLRTANRLRSLVELSRLIGYQPSPGVSASTYLAFTLKGATGLPADPTTPAIIIPKGTQVQSVPAQGLTPQTFETSADILAKPDWSALAVQTGVPWVPQMGDLSVYLQGTATQLQPGDAILIVGDERLTTKTSENWDVRIVTAVTVDSADKRTLVTWSEPLGDKAAGVEPARQNPKFYALRQRAALFGYNAVNPLMLDRRTVKTLSKDGFLNLAQTEWIFGVNPVDGSSLASDSLVDLDAVYSKLSHGGWLALIKPDKQTSRSPAGFVRLYRIDSVTTIARSDYGISSKISRLATDTNANLSTYYDGTRSTVALTQSEALPAAEQPLDHPLYGAFIDLQELRPDLVKLQGVAVTGKAQKLSVNPNLSPALIFTPDDPTASPVTLNAGDVLTIIDPVPLPKDPKGDIPPWASSASQVLLRVTDSSGRTGSVNAQVSQFTLAPPAASDPVVQEYAPVSSVQIATEPFARTRICLKSNLQNCYDRSTTTVNVNVGLATAGKTTTEILGNGSAAMRNQRFTLKQTPLTFVQAPTPTGRQSTLQVTANGVAWTEEPSLYNQDSTQQVFATLNEPGGVTQVLFGDGIEGSPLPTGQNNVQATYRVGSGAAGNVAASSITTLIDRPLGVSGVTNPQAATGGQDAQSADEIRANAPQSVLTLGRAVSVEDYQNFAATFAGIAKAHAIWIPSGPGRGLFLTVAASGGAALPPGNPTLAYLVTALQAYGNPLIPITAQSFLETLFRVEADVRCDPAYDPAAVKAAVKAALAQRYSFAARSFGQGVSSDEIEAFIQAVPGVVAVNVTGLNLGLTSAGGDLTGGSYSVAAYLAWQSEAVNLPRPPSGSPWRICPYLPVPTPTGLPHPAEILALDPGPKGFILRDMP
jgi:hypothetical protein